MKKIVIMYCLQFIARYGLVKIRMENLRFISSSGYAYRTGAAALEF